MSLDWFGAGSQRRRRGAVVSVSSAVAMALAVSLVAADPGGPGPVHGRGRGRGQPDVFTWVPPPEMPYDGGYGRGRVYFYGKDRLDVPGVVAVNRPPYVCDLDERTFADKQAFVAHLRSAHPDRLAERPEPSFVIVDGQVHFTGR